MSDTTSLPLDADDPGLTAYALGELDGPEAAKYAALVAASAELQACVAEIQSAARMLTTELAREPAVPLTAERRTEIAAKCCEVQPVAAARKQRFPGYARRMAAVAAAVALVPGAWYAYQSSFATHESTSSGNYAEGAKNRPQWAQSSGYHLRDDVQYTPVAPASTPAQDSRTHFTSGQPVAGARPVAESKSETLLASVEPRSQTFALDGSQPAEERYSKTPVRKPVASGPVDAPDDKSAPIHSPQKADGERSSDLSRPRPGSGGQGSGQPSVSPELLNGLKGDVKVESVPDTGVMILRGSQKDVAKTMEVIRKLEAEEARQSSKKSGGAGGADGKPAAQPGGSQSTGKPVAATPSDPNAAANDFSDLLTRHKFNASDLKTGLSQTERLGSAMKGLSKEQAQSSGGEGKEGVSNRESGNGQKSASPFPSFMPPRAGDKPADGYSSAIDGIAAGGSGKAGGPAGKQLGDKLAASKSPASKSDKSESKHEVAELDAERKLVREKLPKGALNDQEDALSDPKSAIQKSGDLEKQQVSLADGSKKRDDKETKKRKDNVVAYAEIDRLNKLTDLAERDIQRQEWVKKNALGWAEKELPWQDGNWNAGNEAYNPIFENSFISPTAEPLSTFSIDVDTASYANMRRFLQNGQLPPPDAVRIEELVNYFAYQYPQPQDGRPFSVQTDIAACPWQPGHQLVRIGLKGKEIPKDQRPPTNLVFLVDVSGSMSPANKLPLVRESLKTLVGQLDERDKIAIVTYAGQAGVALPSTSVAQSATIIAAINSLGAGGSTNGAAGINTAYDIAAQEFLEKGTNRVILCTDGDFNVGVTSDNALVQMIQTRAKGGVFLSIFGFGMGNLKDAKLEQLADKGNGQYGYIDDTQEANKVFVQELMGTLVTIAKDVKIQIDFNKESVLAYRLVGYENRVMAAEDFANDKKDAGEIGAGHTVTALYQIVPAKDLKANNETRWLTVKLRYKQPDADTSVLFENPLVGQPGQLKLASSDFQFAASVAATGMLLRHSQYAGQSNWGLVKELAQSGLSFDPHGHRRSFIGLVSQAESLMGQLRPASPPAPDSTVRGKYKSLLRRLNAPEDADKYGQFNDYGYSDTKSWAGAENLPAGYWVYMAPHWYIWAETTQTAEK